MRTHLVGGVTAGWNYLGDEGPVVVERASGPYIWDGEGNRLLDFIMGWGSLLLGHSPRMIRDALVAVIEESGFLHQYETALHEELADLVCENVPGAERIRLANSGFEATEYAIRLARSFTGRPKVVKFEGHFHGLNEVLLFGIDTSGLPAPVLDDGTIATVAGSSGLGRASAHDVLVLPFNEPAVLRSVFERYGDEIACVILEPISLNTGCVAPDDGFLEELRELTADSGSLLVFDEILTGFRVALGGAQEHFGITADLACFGKVLGCGMPIAAVAGREDVMDRLVPTGDVQMSGTNTGRLLTVAGSVAALRHLVEHAGTLYPELQEKNDRLVDGIRTTCREHGVPVYVEGYGGRIGVYLGREDRPRNYRDVVEGWDGEFHRRCYGALRTRGFYGFLLPLTACPEPVTLSLAHGPDDLDRAVEALGDVLAETPYAASRR